MNTPKPFSKFSFACRRRRKEAESPARPRASASLRRRLQLLFTAAMALWLLLPAGFAAEESCASCDKKVIFSGDFTHRRAPNRIVIDGAPPGMENYYRE